MKRFSVFLLVMFFTLNLTRAQITINIGCPIFYGTVKAVNLNSGNNFLGTVGSVMNGNNNNSNNNFYYPLKIAENYVDSISSICLNEKLLDKKFNNQDILEDSLISTRIEYKSDSAKYFFKLGKLLATVNAYDSVVKYHCVDTSSAKKITDLINRVYLIIGSANCLGSNHESEMISKEDDDGVTQYGFPIAIMENDPNYVFVDEFFCGLAIVKRSNKFGFINSDSIVIDFKYDYVEPYSEGLICVQNNGECFYIDRKDSINLYLPEVINCGSFKKGIAWVKFIDGREGLINQKGELISNKYFKISNDDYFSYGVRKVYKKDNTGKIKVGLIDSKGEVFVKPEFEEIGSFNSYKLAISSKSDKKGLINTDGKEIIEPRYDSIYPFNNHGVAIFMTAYDYKGEVSDSHIDTISNSRYYTIIKPRYHYFGLIDTNGKIIIKNVFVNISPEGEGYYKISSVVSNGILCGLLNESGKVKVSCRYDSIDSFVNSLAIVKNWNGWGLIDTNGLEVIPPVFINLERLDNGDYKASNNPQSENNFGTYMEEDYKLKSNSGFVKSEYSKQDINYEFLFDKDGHCKVNCEKYAELLKEFFLKK